MRKQPRFQSGRQMQVMLAAQKGGLTPLEAKQLLFQQARDKFPFEHVVAHGGPHDPRLEEAEEVLQTKALARFPFKARGEAVWLFAHTHHKQLFIEQFGQQEV